VEADFAIELAADDETLTIPWSAPDNSPRYYDLKRHPELLTQIEEAQTNEELCDFLSFLNSATPLETAKCDAWSTTELNPGEEIFEATHKFASYIDILFSTDDRRTSLAEHETFAKRLTELLKRVPEIPASAEFLIRRCYWNENEGFYMTFYLFGYGDDEQKARRQWMIGLKLVENALRQVTAGW
jgi:hypothetical protein